MEMETRDSTTERVSERFKTTSIILTGTARTPLGLSIVSVSFSCVSTVAENGSLDVQLLCPVNLVAKERFQVRHN